MKRTPTSVRRWLALGLASSATGVAQLGWNVASVRIRALALRIDPERLETWLRQARALRLQGRRPEGLECLLRAERLVIARDAACDRASDPARNPSGDAIGRPSSGAARRAAIDPDAAASRRRAVAENWALLARGWVVYSKSDAAEQAQKRAVALAPESASVWHGYARLLAKTGREEEMIEAHRRAYALDPDAFEKSLGRAYALIGREAMASDVLPRLGTRRAIAREQHKRPPPIQPRPMPHAPDAPGAPGAEARKPAPAPIVIDLTDLLLFVKNRGFVSGIQRVQAELALAMLKRGGKNAVYPAVRGPNGQWRLADPQAMIALIRGLRRRGILQNRRINRLVAAASKASGRDFKQLDRPVLFTPGATWSDWRYLLAVREAKRQQGLRFVPFVHDCIPLILPETCSPDVPQAYCRWLAGAAELADAFLVNSQRTGADLRAVLDLAVKRNVAIGAVPLDGRTSLGPRVEKPHLDHDMFRALERRGFAICVGSIEPRKNHLLLFRAWRQIMAKHGDKTPLLVVIGRTGWREDEALDFLDASPVLKAAVILLPDVPDAELAWFYANAMFSVCPSLYEGWGMPITESMNAGLPVLAARNSALVEAGGDAATYFASGDVRDLVQKLEPLLFNGSVLSAAKARAEAATSREWGALAQDALRVLRRVAAGQPDPRRLAPRLTPGRRYDFTHRDFGADLVAQEAGLHGQAWLGRDLEGLWTATGGPARFCARVETQAPGVALAMEIIAPNRPVVVTATLEAAVGEERRSGDMAKITLAPDEAARLSLPLPALAPSRTAGKLFLEAMIETTEVGAETETQAVGARGVCIRAVTVEPAPTD